jgi:hypothetical protein
MGDNARISGNSNSETKGEHVKTFPVPKSCGYLTL